MLKRILNQIPGQVRAYTWAEALVAGGAAYIATKELLAVVGMVIFVLGGYLGNQATHLEQEEHKASALTWIERQQQNYTHAFQFLGLLLAVLGVWMAWTPLL
jgi:hypothetical protein